MIRLPLVCAALAMLCPTGAFAADATQSFLSSPAHQRDSAEKIKVAAVSLFPGCTSVSMSPENFAIMTPIEFDDRGIPRVGIWREVFNAGGCGRARKLTLFWAADPRGDMHVTVGVPGTTRTEFNGQKVAAAQAVNAAATKYPGCTSGSIDDTRYDMALLPPAGAPASQVSDIWQETWVVAMCGHLVDVPVTFSQSGAQLEIKAQPAQATDHK